MTDLKISALPVSTVPLAGTEVLPIIQSGTTKQVTVANLTAGRPVAVNTLTSTGKITAGTGVTTVGLLINTTNDSAQVDYQPTGGDRFMAGAGIIATNDWGLYNATRTRVDFTVPGGASGGNLTPGTAAKGINFTANTPAAGMTSQLLNWYEEGTWTPTVFGSTGAGTYELSANSSFTYQKVGNNVTVIARIVAAAVVTGGGTGDIRISGLPFNMSATVYGSPFTAVSSGLVFTGSYLAAERVTSGSTATVYPYGVSALGVQTQVPIGNFVANSIVSFQFQYRV